mgnify:CR=1 FL=1
MSKFVLYLEVKPFLRQWLTYHYGDPVRFPLCCRQNIEIVKSLTRLAPGRTPAMPTHSTVAIVIPDNKQRPPAVYNQLSRAGEIHLRKVIDDLFSDNFLSEMRRYRRDGLSVLDSVYTYCKAHHIDIDHANTLRQRDYRERKLHAKCGVDLTYHERIC